jgi:hypothetical protein
VLVAALAGGAAPDALVPAAELAAETAAGVVEARGALTGLPVAERARAALQAAVQAGGRR